MIDLGPLRGSYAEALTEVNRVCVCSAGMPLFLPTKCGGLCGRQRCLRRTTNGEPHDQESERRSEWASGRAWRRRDDVDAVHDAGDMPEDLEQDGPQHAPRRAFVDEDGQERKEEAQYYQQCCSHGSAPVGSVAVRLIPARTASQTARLGGIPLTAGTGSGRAGGPRRHGARRQARPRSYADQGLVQVTLLGAGVLLPLAVKPKVVKVFGLIVPL